MYCLQSMFLCKPGLVHLGYLSGFYKCALENKTKQTNKKHYWCAS